MVASQKLALASLHGLLSPRLLKAPSAHSAKSTAVLLLLSA